MSTFWRVCWAMVAIAICLTLVKGAIWILLGVAILTGIWAVKGHVIPSRFRKKQGDPKG